MSNPQTFYSADVQNALSQGYSMNLMEDIARLLDSLGLSLADHGHTWTQAQREAFDRIRPQLPDPFVPA